MEEYESVYKKMYLALFRNTRLAIEAMEQQNYGTAKDLLISGHQKTEELFMEAEEE